MAPQRTPALINFNGFLNATATIFHLPRSQTPADLTGAKGYFHSVAAWRAVEVERSEETGREEEEGSRDVGNQSRRHDRAYRKKINSFEMFYGVGSAPRGL